MNFLRTILAFVALAMTIPATAQKYNKQKLEETTIKSYAVDTGSDLINYSVKVESTESNWVKTQKTDKDALERIWVNDPQLITKTISVSSDDAPSYDKVLKLSYKAENDHDFRIYPTPEGFAIEASGNAFKYKLIDKEYYIDESSVGFFDVIFDDSE